MAFTGKENGQLCRCYVTEALAAALKYFAAVATNHRGKRLWLIWGFARRRQHAVAWLAFFFNPAPAPLSHTSKSSYRPRFAVSAPVWAWTPGQRNVFFAGKRQQWWRSNCFWSAGFKKTSLCLFSGAKKTAQGLAEELRVCFYVWLSPFDAVILSFITSFFRSLQFSSFFLPPCVFTFKFLVNKSC